MTRKIFKDNRKGIIADMHTHSEHSHDSACHIKDMAESEHRKGVGLFAVTDHCDVEFFKTFNLKKSAFDSLKDIENQSGETEILKGIEIGEGFWNKELTQQIIKENDFDVVLGSVHAVKFEGLEKPFSKIDFSQFSKETVTEYLNKYFDDMLYMLKNTDIDILAHLTVPLRYINGKYDFGIDCRIYKEKITEILKYIIEKEIALEINTSCKGSNYDEFMPEEWIVTLYKQLGGYLITLGSDAHIAGNAAHRFDEAIEMLKRNGFNSAYYYKNRFAYEYKF